MTSGCHTLLLFLPALQGVVTAAFSHTWGIKWSHAWHPDGGCGVLLQSCQTDHGVMVALWKAAFIWQTQRQTALKMCRGLQQGKAPQHHTQHPQVAADTGAKPDAVTLSAFLLTQICLAVLPESQAVRLCWTKIKLSKEFGPQMSVFSGHSSFLPNRDCEI